jgi:integrase/recombinase XerD
MKQARVINESEMKRLLAVIAAGKHAERNRCAVMLSYLSGMRVGEIAQLRIGDVFKEDGTMRDQILLKAAYTKTKETRAVFVSKRLHAELSRYARFREPMEARRKPLLLTQKLTAFSPNTLCQLFGTLV